MEKGCFCLKLEEKRKVWGRQELQPSFTGWSAVGLLEEKDSRGVKKIQEGRYKKNNTTVGMMIGIKPSK